MSPSADIAVVGAGIVGLSTAYALRERGARVTLYERGVPGNGQSGGDSRIFRHAHRDPRLVAFAQESRALWRAWEQRSGRELVSRDGVITVGPAAVERCGLLRAAGVRARLIDPGEVPDRLPLLAPCAGPVLLDEDGGVIRTTAAIEMLSASVADALVFDEVMSVRAVGDRRVEVRTGAIVVKHDRAVVCAGRGTGPLARSAGLALPIGHSAHVRLAYAVRGEPPRRLACLLEGSGAFGEPTAYADPLPGNGLYAVGLDETPARDDGALTDPDGLATIAQRTTRYVTRALPGLVPEPVQARHCWITQLPWAEDAFAVWSAGAASFLAGHNLFKHAPALGRALAAHALGETTSVTLDPADRLGAP